MEREKSEGGECESCDSVRVGTVRVYVPAPEFAAADNCLRKARERLQC